MTRQCSDCGKFLCRDTKGEKCFKCLRPPRQFKYCGCGSTLGRYNKSGLCKVCICRRNSADPDVLARRREACQKAWESPGRRAEASRIMTVVCRRPEMIEARRVNGRRLIQRTLMSPAAIARRDDPEVRARGGATQSRTKLAAIPPAWLAEYRKLKQRHGMTRPKALAILAERERAKLAAMSPFERQLHALQNGARLVDKPILRSRDYDFTLGGVSDLSA